MRLQRMAMGVVAATLVAGSTGAMAAQSTAPNKPLGKITCEDFIALDDSFKPKMVYWAVAYGQGGKPESAGINVEAPKRCYGPRRSVQESAQGILLGESKSGS